MPIFDSTDRFPYPPLHHEARDEVAGDGCSKRVKDLVEQTCGCCGCHIFCSQVKSLLNRALLNAGMYPIRSHPVQGAVVCGP